jgi:hypothetical protein
MESYPNWNEWKTRRADGPVVESKGQAPNYSFDNWLKMTKNFGDEISSFIGQSKERDKELDDEIEKKKKEPPEKSTQEDDDDAGDSDKSEKESAWKKLKDIAKERMKSKKDGKEKPSKSSASS